MSGPFNCERFGRLWRGCRFEARYHMRAPQGGPEQVLSAIVNGFIQDKSYVHDVCVRCGRVVGKQPDAVGKPPEVK